MMFVSTVVTRSRQARARSDLNKLSASNFELNQCLSLKSESSIIITVCFLESNFCKVKIKSTFLVICPKNELFSMYSSIVHTLMPDSTSMHGLNDFDSITSRYLPIFLTFNFFNFNTYHIIE